MPVSPAVKRLADKSRKSPGKSCKSCKSRKSRKSLGKLAKLAGLAGLAGLVLGAPPQLEPGVLDVEPRRVRLLPVLLGDARGGPELREDVLPGGLGLDLREGAAALGRLEDVQAPLLDPGRHLGVVEDDAVVLEADGHGQLGALDGTLDGVELVALEGHVEERHQGGLAGVCISIILFC